MNISRIRKRNFVVIPRIARMGNDISSSDASRLDGMGLQRPVANVDQMNRLLDDDVAR